MLLVGFIITTLIGQTAGILTLAKRFTEDKGDIRKQNCTECSFKTLIFDQGSKDMIDIGVLVSVFVSVYLCFSSVVGVSFCRCVGDCVPMSVDCSL